MFFLMFFVAQAEETFRVRVAIVLGSANSGETYIKCRDLVIDAE